MLRNNIIAVMIAISTISFVGFTMTSFNAFAQNNCASQDNAACAQSDLSLPVPSENDILAPAVQSQDADEDLRGQDDESEDNGNAFLLPFP